MRIKAWTCVLAVVLLLACVLATWARGLWWKQRQWFDLQHRQLAVIERIGEFSPSGWRRGYCQNHIPDRLPEKSNVLVRDAQCLTLELVRFIWAAGS